MFQKQHSKGGCNTSTALCVETVMVCKTSLTLEVTTRPKIRLDWGNHISELFASVFGNADRSEGITRKQI